MTSIIDVKERNNLFSVWQLAMNFFGLIDLFVDTYQLEIITCCAFLAETDFQF